VSKPTIPDSSEPFLREGRNSAFWYRFFEGLTAAYNSTVDGISGAVAAIADVWAATPDKTFTTGLIETASAPVTLTDAATVALNWDTFINGEVTITANRILGNPTNGQPGTWRTVYVIASSGTRTLTFGNQYLGDVPLLTDITTAKAYLLMVYCRTASHFVVSAKRAL
jgi:hypothetical protein